MPVRTLAEVTAELTAVDAAITNALSAQSYGIGGRQKVNANLETLYKRKKELLVERERLSSTTGEGGTSRNPIFNTRT